MLFFSAASFGNPECIKVLLNNCLTPDPRDSDGVTPFLAAVAAGHTNCAKLLLESGADITARDKYQRCCIHLAVENGKVEILTMLLERSGSQLANVPDIHERTALHYAAFSTNIKVNAFILNLFFSQRHPLKVKCVLFLMFKQRT